MIYCELPSYSIMATSWLSTSPWALRWLVFYYSSLFLLIAASGSSYICSRTVYGSPVMSDCSLALATLPRADSLFNYYLEQQLLTGPPAYNWQALPNDRSSSSLKKAVQIPKFWSHRTASSFVNGLYQILSIPDMERMY